MKIGILTYHRAINYGAILQAYALQTFLEEHGHDVTIVDYWPDYHSQIYDVWNYKLFKSYKMLSALKYTSNALLRFIRYCKKRKGFEKFITENLHVNKRYDFDAVVYGSDQIWRKQKYTDKAHDYNPIYFGEGLVNTNIKIAYAASMGKLYTEEEDKIFFNKYLSNFAAISVRESDLLSFLKGSTNYNIQQTLDPTLLVGQHVWNKFIHKEPPSVPKYILYYKLHEIAAADSAVEILSKEYGLQVVVLTGIPKPFHYSKKYYETAAVYEFLQLMAWADFVVTTSFHGMAMAIQFQKQFCAFTIPRTQNRLLSLLSILNLTDRLNPQSVSNLGTIDYGKVYMILEKEREVSAQWLLNNLTCRN